MPKLQYLARTALVLAFFCALRAAADVVVTTNGARIVGKIQGIHEGTITIKTDYAGELKVKQELVTLIETDRPVAVRLKGGTRAVGVVTETADGRLRIADRHGDVYARIGEVAASWAAVDEDPDVVARRRKWAFEAGADINGESGTNHQMGTNLVFKATLKGPNDALVIFSNYNRQVTNGEKAADQFKAGIDYSDNFSQATSWYVRGEAGFDRVKDITFDEIAAAGFGYDFIKRKGQTLTARAGLSYRDYEYSPQVGTPNVSALGADFEVQYARTIWRSQLADKIAYIPEFKNTSNFVVLHDLSFVVPITKDLWKLSLGITNTYDSRPADGVDRLETLYYTRLVLTWRQR